MAAWGKMAATVVALVVALVVVAAAAKRPASLAPYVKSTRTTPAPAFGRPMLAEFKFDPNYRNFNFGSFGAVPSSVWAVYSAYQERMEAVPDPWMRTEYRDLIPVVRERVAAYLGTRTEDVVLIENTSAGVNAVYRSYRFRAGDKLVMFSNDYPVTKNILKWFADTDGVQVITVNISIPVVSDEETFLGPVRRVLDAHPDTRMLIFSHVVSSPGIVQPAAAIIQLCRERGVAVLVDGAHAPGLIDLNIAALNPDYYVGNLHKWLYSPKGAAFLWVNPEHQVDVVPTVVSSEFDSVDYIKRFLYVGTRDYCPMIATLAALDFRESVGGDAAVKTYMSDLAWWAGQYLTGRWNTTLFAPRAYVAAMIDVGLPLDTFAQAQALQAWLYDEHGVYIVVQQYLDRPSTRLSAQIFLEQADFVDLADLVLQFASAARGHTVV